MPINWVQVIKFILPWILRLLGMGGVVASGVDMTALTNDPEWTAATMAYTGSAWAGPSLAAIFGSFLPIFQQCDKKAVMDLDIMDFLGVLQQKLAGSSVGSFDPIKLQGILKILVSLGDFAKMLLDKLPALPPTDK